MNRPDAKAGSKVAVPKTSSPRYYTKQERRFCPPCPFPSIVTFEDAVHLELGGGGGSGGGVTAPLADTWTRARSV